MKWPERLGYLQGEFRVWDATLQHLRDESLEIPSNRDQVRMIVSVRRLAWSIARDGVCFLRAVRSRSG